MSQSPLMSRLYYFWLPLSFVIIGILYYSQNRYNPDKEAQNGLQRLNQWRLQTGLQPFNQHPLLEKAAQNHAQYLSKDAHGHDELNPSNPYFTGKTPQARATAVGYPASVSENLTISTWARSGKNSIDGLMTAIYHRLSLLNPDDNEAGVAWVRGKQQAFVVKQANSEMRELCQQSPSSQPKRYILTMTCLGQETKIPIDQPPQQQQIIVKYPIGEQIDPSYNGTEEPNPLPHRNETGNPISIAFHGYDPKQKIEMLTFRLYHEQTHIQDVKLLNASNDPNHLLAPTEFVLFPNKPLDFNTEYRVEFEYLYQQQSHSETWTFKTRKKKHLFEF